YSPVTRAEQERALEFISAQVFEEPLWLLDDNVLARIRVAGPQRLQQQQAAMVASLLSSSRLARMAEIELTHPAAAWPVSDYLADVRAEIWSSAAVTARNAYRRALHRAH